MSTESTTATPQGAEPASQSQGAISTVDNVSTVTPVEPEMYHQLLKKHDDLSKDNKQQRDELRAYKEKEKALKEKEKALEEEELKKRGEFEKLVKTREDELAITKSAAAKLEKVVKLKLEDELSNLTVSQKEKFELLYSDITDPTDMLEKLIRFKQAFPDQKGNSNPNKELPTSQGSEPSTTLKTAETERILKYGSPAEKAKILSLIGSKMQTW